MIISPNPIWLPLIQVTLKIIYIQNQSQYNIASAGAYHDQWYQMHLSFDCQPEPGECVRGPKCPKYNLQFKSRFLF